MTSYKATEVVASAIQRGRSGNNDKITPLRPHGMKTRNVDNSKDARDCGRQAFAMGYRAKRGKEVADDKKIANGTRARNEVCGLCITGENQKWQAGWFAQKPEMAATKMGGAKKTA